MGSEADMPWFAAFRAEACQKVGQIEEGLRALDETLAYIDKNRANTACENTGTARSDQSQPPVLQSGQGIRSPTDAIGDLQLVYRGIRDCRSSRSQTAACGRQPAAL